MLTHFSKLTLTRCFNSAISLFEPQPNEVSTFLIYVSQVSGIFCQSRLAR